MSVFAKAYCLIFYMIDGLKKNIQIL